MRLLALSDGDPSAPLPALALLPHSLRHLPLDASRATDLVDVDAIIVDATGDLARARSVCFALRASVPAPVIVVMPETALAILSPEWGVAELILAGAVDGATSADFSETPRPERDAAMRTAQLNYVTRLENFCRLAPYNWFNFFDFWQKK